MFHTIVNNLVNNLPDYLTSQSKPINIDLILDGGAFNGSYLVGALYLLKEMEKRQYIKIKRISGCSIGSVVGFLYFIDALDMIPKLYEKTIDHIKEKHNLAIIKDLNTLLKNKTPNNICSIINNKLIITYNNMDNGIKCVKKKYKNTDDIFQTITNSCFIPYLIDGNILNENKYMDGITPYIFKEKKHRKILYLDLFGYDKICNIFNIKNENTNSNRVLNGLLDIHLFFIKKTSTSMCSYINNWSLYEKLHFNVKWLIEKIILFIIRIIIVLKKCLIRFDEKSTVGLSINLIKKIISELFTIIIDCYFI